MTDHCGCSNNKIFFLRFRVLFSFHDYVHVQQLDLQSPFGRYCMFVAADFT